MSKVGWLSSVLVVGLCACSGKSTLGSGKDEQNVEASSDATDSDGVVDTTDGSGETEESAETGDTSSDSDVSDSDETSSGTDSAANDPGAETDASETEDSASSPGNEEATETDASEAEESANSPGNDETTETDADGGGEAANDGLCAFNENITLVDPSEFPTGQLDGASDEECAQREEEIERLRSDVVEVEVAPLAGTWRGSFDDEEIELIVDATGNGSLRYGAPVELPPIDDPSDGYLQDGADGPAPPEFMPRLGFTYTLFPQGGRASELVASLRLGEPWQEWCALQEPQRTTQCYACDRFGNSSVNFFYPDDECNDTGERLCYATYDDGGETIGTPLNCERYFMCGPFQSVCACTSEDCTDNPQYTVERTITLDPVDTTVIRIPNRWGGETAYLTRVTE